MTPPARVVRSLVVTPLAALVLLCLTLLGASGLAALVLLALDHRASLRRIERKQDANHEQVAERLRSDRPCVLHDLTYGTRGNEKKLPNGDDFS